MRCRDCSYGIEDFNRRMYWYNKIVSERGIPNSIYGDLQSDEVADEFEQFVWCDKVGGKVYCFGHCSEWYEQNNKTHKNYSQKRKLNKRERYLKHQNHLKHLYEVAGGYYPTPVRYTDEIWIKGQGFVENPKPYYQRLYRGKRSSYLKKQSNKKIRRYKGELSNGYQHIHKLYDFWWEYS